MDELNFEFISDFSFLAARNISDDELKTRYRKSYEGLLAKIAKLEAELGDS